MATSPAHDAPASPADSGYFFRTLAQSNASAEHVNASGEVGEVDEVGEAREAREEAREEAHEAACPPAMDPSLGLDGLDSLDGPDDREAPRRLPPPPASLDSDATLEAGRTAAAAAATATARAKTRAAEAAAAAARGEGEKANAAAAAAAAAGKDARGWRKLVRNFMPSWFLVSMGTGVVSVLLYTLPYNTAAVRYIGIAVFCFNMGLFAALSAITITRYVLYPEIWGVMVKHPSQSLFLGCIPMAFSTIVSMIVLVCARWGPWAIYLAWALWWVDVIGACSCSLIIPFVVVHHHRNKLSHLTAALLLPVTPVVVAASSGALLAGALPDRGHAVTTLVASYVLWGLGESFSFFIMAVYFLRLQIHDLPPRETIVSVFLPLSPLGQGGYTIQRLGRAAVQLLPATAAFNGDSIDRGPAAEAASAMYGGAVCYYVGLLCGFFLWGCAIGWLAFAVIAIFTTKSFPFNMGWWGFVFPLGVFTTCTSTFAIELSSVFFRVLAMIFSASVFCLWALVAVKTILMLRHGDMFYAPCLRDLRPKEEQCSEPV